MKSKLEILWLIIQIISVCLAGYWGVTRWYLEDYPKIKPGFIANISGLDNYEKWDEYGCSIGAYWTLKNTGESTFKIKDISYQVFGVKDDSSSLSNGEQRDRSLGRLLANAEYKSDIVKFEKSHDTVTKGGKISRNIVWQYKPEICSLDMFKTHNIAIKVTGNLYSDFSWWCPICPSVTDTTSYITSLKKYCQGD